MSRFKVKKFLPSVDRIEKPLGRVKAKYVNFQKKCKCDSFEKCHHTRSKSKHTSHCMLATHMEINMPFVFYKKITTHTDTDPPYHEYLTRADK